MQRNRGGPSLGQGGFSDGREGDRAVSGTMADGSQGFTPADATPRERERWYAILLLAQGWTASATVEAEALERDPHTVGRWASAFGEGGPAALIFEQTGGSPQGNRVLIKFLKMYKMVPSGWREGRWFMAKSNGASIIDCFATLEDPRIELSKRHKLLDIITIAICAIICGADSWVHIEMFGRSKEEWSQTFLELPGGIPSHDTLGEVFSRLDPEQFQSCFMGWTREVAQLAPGEVVAIDGKTVRRSYDRSRSRQAIHLVSAWASANTMTLGQVKTEEKSNEITAIPRLLELLDLHGCIVTIDAMGCQREIAEQIVDAGADYVLAVKDNQGRLYDDVRDLF